MNPFTADLPFWLALAAVALRGAVSLAAIELTLRRARGGAAESMVSAAPPAPPA